VTAVIDEYTYTPATEPDVDSCQFRHTGGFCENDHVAGYIQITEQMPAFDGCGFWVPGCEVHVEQDTLPEGAEIRHPKGLAEDLKA
jgi:hypothetical protein